MRSVEREFGGAKLVVLGSVRGLVRESKAVREAMDEFLPEALALPVGPRELDEIRMTVADKRRLAAQKKAGRRRKKAPAPTGPTGLPNEPLPADPDDSDYEDFGLFVSSSDMVFVRKLARYGDVEMPPPSYQTAL